jgi:hypothetical protein
MHKPAFCACVLFIALTLPNFLRSQETLDVAADSVEVSPKLIATLSEKADRFQSQLISGSNRYLNRIAKRERALKRKIGKKNRDASNEIFGEVDNTYNKIRSELTDSILSRNPFSNVYNGHLDSIASALKFIKSISSGKVPGSDEALSKYVDLQDELNRINSVQNLLKGREEELRSKLAAFGFTKELEKYKREFYYYRSQINEYKELFENPSKLETKILSVASKFPAFRKFFSQHSQLAQIFRLPDADNSDLTELQGLQTRAQVAQSMEERFGSRSNVSQTISTGVGDANSQLSEVKNKFNENSSEFPEDMPGFKPNTEKTKSFLKRIELGSNFQSNRSNSFLPTTTDVGLSIGYKINQKSIAGIGASYKLGWGRDIRHIALTHEGAGLRSFIDVRLKGSFWITGGGEMNYHSSFKEFEQLKNYSAWQKSALAGISKKYQLRRKLKGNVQLMYDFLSAKQVPKSQPVIFRLGYNFK